MDMLLIAELFASIARIAANPQIGAVNDDVVKYADLLASGIRAGTMTEAELRALKEQMDANNAAGHGMTREQLDELGAKIKANSEAIQNG